ncbi:MAG: hypothetical protein HC892_05710 [Saprospiraceae bacterium]|nr:hypothetical protein [Saprospiraceae bacterium]
MSIALPTPLGEINIHTIKAYETDVNKRATPVAILKVMHEAAQQKCDASRYFSMGLTATKFGVGVDATVCSL